MITSKVIDQIYKNYKRPPASPDELDVDLLFQYLLDNHDIAFDDNANLVIGNFPDDSPFHTIPLKNIHAIIEFDRKIAIVFHSSILFLNKYDSGSHLHVKMPYSNLLSRLFSRRESDD